MLRSALSMTFRDGRYAFGPAWRLAPSDSRLAPSDSRLTPSDSRLTPSDSRLTPSDSRLRAYAPTRLVSERCLACGFAVLLLAPVDTGQAEANVDHQREPGDQARNEIAVEAGRGRLEDANRPRAHELVHDVESPGGHVGKEDYRQQEPHCRFDEGSDPGPSPH